MQGKHLLFLPQPCSRPQSIFPFQQVYLLRDLLLACRRGAGHVHHAEEESCACFKNTSTNSHPTLVLLATLAFGGSWTLRIPESSGGKGSEGLLMNDETLERDPFGLLETPTGPRGSGALEHGPVKWSRQMIRKET